MKVRYKHGFHPVHEVLEESPSYYITKDNSGAHVVLEKHSYEPVPIERWVDVTGECYAVNGETIDLIHGSREITVDADKAYRLRK